MFFDIEAADAQLAADAVNAFWLNVSGMIVNTVTWSVEDLATVIDPVTGQPTGVVAVDGDTGVGGAAGGMMPRAAQGLIQWRTGVWQAGREIRGKTYVPGLDNEFSTLNGEFVPAQQQLLATYASDLLTTPGNPNLVVWSRKYGTVTPVTSGAVSNQFAVLRSRRD